MRHLLIGMGLTLAVAAAGGCQTTTGSWTLGLVQSPSAAVQSVELTEVSEAGAAAHVVVELTNPNDVPLPLPIANYRVRLGETDYKGDSHPNATIPANGSQRIALPFAVSGQPGGKYRVTGSITYRPPGEIRQLLTDIGIPLPWITLNASGDVTGDPERREYAAPPAEPESEPEPTDAEPEKVPQVEAS